MYDLGVKASPSVFILKASPAISCAADFLPGFLLSGSLCLRCG